MKKMIPILIAGTLLFTGCGKDTSAGAPTANNTPQAAESGDTINPEKLTEEERDALIQELLENTLKEVGDMEYEIDMSDKSFATVKVWKEGITEALTLAKSGNQEAIDAWNTLRDSLLTMDNELQDRVDLIGSERTVVIMLMNDANLEKTLLALMDGTVVNDALNPEQSETTAN